MDSMRWILLSGIVLTMVACGGGSADVADDAGDDGVVPPVQVDDPLDTELRALIGLRGLSGDPAAGRIVPSINDPLPQLGMKLFFSKSLGGRFDAACASCHHPSLGGADALSLAVGIAAIDPDLLGPGRENTAGVPVVPRNSPTTFNTALWDSGLFLDSRVESLGKENAQNGAASGISTPDSGIFVIDGEAGRTLASAQARFPVTSVDEMRADLEPGAGNDVLRDHLAGRLGNYGAGAGEIAASDWLAEFRTAFASAAPAEQLITFANIAEALAEYERSQLFVDNPWRSYVGGDNGAIGDQAKRGAILFLTAADDGGAACFQCHLGDAFTDERHHVIGAPQFGVGKGNPNDNDFGRENVTGNSIDRFRFRTPSLLNVALTAPYTHTGAYETLDEIVAHYNNPRGQVDDFFDDGGWCQLQQFQFVAGCAGLYPDALANTNLALQKSADERAQNDPDALPNVSINGGERAQIVAFLHALTDACAADDACTAAWVPQPADAPDEHQLNAVDQQGNPL